VLWDFKAVMLRRLMLCVCQPIVNKMLQQELLTITLTDWHYTYCKSGETVYRSTQNGNFCRMGFSTDKKIKHNCSASCYYFCTFLVNNSKTALFFHFVHLVIMKVSHEASTRTRMKYIVCVYMCVGMHAHV